MRPNLQLALDLVNLEKALLITRAALPWIDWIEAGTPLIINEGLKAVTKLSEYFPHKPIIADLKIVDAAKILTNQAIYAKANVVTVLSAASDQTISTCVETAHQNGIQVLGDHISDQVSIDACRRMVDLGVDFVGVHIPKDSGAMVALAPLESLLVSLKFPAVLAGGLTTERLENMSGWPVSAFVIGNSIINHPEPAVAAQGFAEILNNWK